MDLGVFDLLRVRTGWTGEDVGGRCFASVDDLEEGSVERAEPHVLIAIIDSFEWCLSLMGRR